MLICLVLLVLAAVMNFDVGEMMGRDEHEAPENSIEGEDINVDKKPVLDMG